MSAPMLPCSFAKQYNCNYTTPATFNNHYKALKELELHHASHFKEEKVKKTMNIGGVPFYDFFNKYNPSALICVLIKL